MNVIVDTGGANLASVKNALARLHCQAVVTRDADRISKARRVILPGVGAAGDVMEKVKEAGLVDTIRSLRQPLLGICVGMQLLYERSAEGNVACLGLIPGSLGKLEASQDVTVPHMGWNRIEIMPGKEGSMIPQDLSGHHMYFVHSYAAPVSEYTTSTSTHGIPFTASVEKDNYSGTQFHPEKSGPAGARILEEFLK